MKKLIATLSLITLTASATIPPPPGGGGVPPVVPTQYTTNRVFEVNVWFTFDFVGDGQSFATGTNTYSSGQFDTLFWSDASEYFVDTGTNYLWYPFTTNIVSGEWFGSKLVVDPLVITNERAYLSQTWSVNVVTNW